MEYPWAENRELANVKSNVNSMYSCFLEIVSFNYFFSCISYLESEFGSTMIKAIFKAIDGGKGK